VLVNHSDELQSKTTITPMKWTDFRSRFYIFISSYFWCFIIFLGVIKARYKDFSLRHPEFSINLVRRTATADQKQNGLIVILVIIIIRLYVFFAQN